VIKLTVVVTATQNVSLNAKEEVRCTIFDGKAKTFITEGFWIGGLRSLFCSASLSRPKRSYQPSFLKGFEKEMKKVLTGEDTRAQRARIL